LGTGLAFTPLHRRQTVNLSGRFCRREVLSFRSFDQCTEKENFMKTIYATAVCALLGLSAVGCAVTDRQQSAGSYVDDATITSKVKAKFAEDKTVSASRIGVETLKGVVQLSGFATTAEERDRAASLARSVDGVQSVRNSIQIQPKQ
jgi:hyperosmotically inducible protein